jgi:hypothetical protein
MQSLIASKDLVPLMGERVSAPKPTEPVPMTQFLENVGQALMSAQKSLDVESANYLADSASQKHVLKSVFRIPKVSAELKFAIDEITNKGVNLLIYKDEAQARTLNQQSIQFEIVSIPPPPDLPPIPFQVNIVFAKDRRVKILSILPANPWGTDVDAVLVFEIAVGQLLIAYAKDGIGNVGFWYAVEDPLGAVALRPFGAQDGAAVEPTRKTVQALGIKQKLFLSRL